MTVLPVSIHAPSRANILGVGIHAVDTNIAVEIIGAAVAMRRKGYVCAAGVHGVMEAQGGSNLQAIFANALLVVPDGMPTVWMGRLQGQRDMKRVFGPDLMLAVAGHPRLGKCSHFLYGGADGVATELERELRRQCPHINIVGTYTPPFRHLTEEEELEFIHIVGQRRPDIIWVGLSTPKQERFMADYLPLLETTLMIGVGAAFDFHTGRLRDSPKWVKSCGLQWLHRLIQEPRRLWRRYLLNNPRFVVKAGLQLAGLRHYSLKQADDNTSGGDTSVTQPSNIRRASLPKS